MCGRLPSPLFPFLLFPSFLIMPFFYLCHPPLYFSCVRSTNAGLDNSISVFNTIMPQFRGSVNHQPHPPPPTQSLSCTWLQTSDTHHALSAALFTPSAHCSLCMFTERLMNFWAHPELVTCRLKKTNCRVCVCVCVYQAGGNRWWGHREGVDG